jgi:hypothetical protein
VKTTVSSSVNEIDNRAIVGDQSPVTGWKIRDRIPRHLIAELGAELVARKDRQHLESGRLQVIDAPDRGRCPREGV